MSLAGAPAAAPIDLAPVTGRALPRRLLALIADTVVISLLEAIANGTFGVTRVTSGIATTIGTGSFTSFTTQTTIDWPFLALLWVTYCAVLEGLFGATIGKGLAGLRVTDIQGRRIGWPAAIVRNLARLLDVLPFGYLFGGILTLATKRHQRLGDLLAGTVVLPVAAVTYPPLQPTVRRGRVIGMAVAAAVLLACCTVFAYFGRPPLVIEGAKNTSDFIFSEGVSSYTLGSPRRGTGTVTYPITYELAKTAQTCRGEVTLNWNWSSLGWAFGYGETQCSPRIYP
jgi:uncharacterized RDD family membrane protein YckC